QIAIEMDPMLLRIPVDVVPVEGGDDARRRRDRTDVSQPQRQPPVGPEMRLHDVVIATAPKEGGRPEQKLERRRVGPVAADVEGAEDDSGTSEAPLQDEPQRLDQPGNDLGGSAAVAHAVE